MRNVIQLFLAANTILLMRKWNHAFLLLAIALAWKWQIASLPEDISWNVKLWSWKPPHGKPVAAILLKSAQSFSSTTP